MQAPRAIVSCKQLILQQFSAQEGLAHEYGSVTDGNGRVRASVVVHAPEIPGRRQEKTHTFYASTGAISAALERAPLRWLSAFSATCTTSTSTT
jgi:hypothetical protein